MVIERERKFLVLPEHLPSDEKMGESRIIEAGYFTKEPPAIRVTVRDHGRPDKEARYKFCVKGPGLEARAEYEYSIPAQDALEMLALSPTYLKKWRFEFDGWEVDRIMLPVEGTYTWFWIAEWEEAEGKGAIPDPLPRWIGKEVTENASFTNMALAWLYGLKHGH